eukprot:m.739170 g.739170  ORF g.739170 m.739170 type:complete len:428 (-) comp23103_c0_seq1:149-1432(-)
MSSPGGGLNFGPDWLTQAIENTSPSASPRTANGPVFGPGGISLGRAPPLGLRSSSGGKDFRAATVGSTETSAAGSQRYKYSSEQILSKFSTDAEVPESLVAFPSVLRREIVYPRTFQPLSETEQRDLHLPVNSQGVITSRSRGSSGGHVDRTTSRGGASSGSFDDTNASSTTSVNIARRSQQWGDRGAGFGGSGEWRSHREKSDVASDGDKWEVVDRFDSRRNSGTHGEYQQQPTRKIEVGPDGQRRLVVLRPDPAGGVDRFGSGGGFSDKRTSFDNSGGGPSSDRFGSSSESMNWRRGGGGGGASGSFGSGRGTSGASFSARDERLGRGFGGGGFRTDSSTSGGSRSHSEYGRGNDDNGSVPEWASEPYSVILFRSGYFLMLQDRIHRRCALSMRCTSCETLAVEQTVQQLKNDFFRGEPIFSCAR